MAEFRVQKKLRSGAGGLLVLLACFVFSVQALAATSTDTPTDTPTYTQTHTDTATATPTVTITVTATATPTDTVTYSPTPTRTPTPSATKTFTLTATPTFTPTTYGSPTHTPTYTVYSTATWTKTATGTPTETDTQTATWTPTTYGSSTDSPTATPYPTQFVNGGFETGDLTGWSLQTATGGPGYVFGLSPTAHSGSFSLALGDLSPGTEKTGDVSVQQTLQIPSSACGPYLDFWYYPSTQETQPDLHYDYQECFITDALGNTLATPVFETSNTQVWTHVVYDLSALTGQIVHIGFLVHEDGYGDVTSMLVDDAQIVTSCLTATPTSTATPSVTVSATMTPTFTLSPSFSVSPTFSGSPTPSATHSPSPTFTASPTFCPSCLAAAGTQTALAGSQTPTPSMTATASPTSTAQRESDVAAALGAPLSVVQAAYDLNLDETTTWIVILIAVKCGCQPSDIMSQRDNNGWGDIAQSYGLTWEQCLSEIQTRMIAVGLAPACPSPGQLLQTLRNESGTEPQPTPVPWLPAGSWVPPAPTKVCP
jgi:hypothetical protein